MPSAKSGRCCARPFRNGDSAARFRFGNISRTSPVIARSEEHTSELQSLMRISYAVFCLKKKNTKIHLTMLCTCRMHSCHLQVCVIQYSVKFTLIVTHSSIMACQLTLTT